MPLSSPLPFSRPARLAATALALAALSACVTTGGGNQPAVQRGALGVPLGSVESSGTRYIQGESKVVIAAFRVAFSQQVSASASSSALFSTNSASTAMKGTLRGLDHATYQAITDAAYADFVDKLRASGLAVLEPRDLAASSAYARLASVPSPAPLDADQGKLLMFAPGGAKLAMFPGDTGAGSAFSGFNAGSPTQVWPALLKEQQAGVMSVTYYVDFLNAASSGKTLVAGGNAEVAMGQGLSVRAGSGLVYSTLRGSQCVGYCPDAHGSPFKLGQAVFSQQAYGTTRDVTDGSVNALGAVSGLLSGRSFSRKDLEIHADPARYQGIARQLLADANTALTDAVRQARSAPAKP